MFSTSVRPTDVGHERFLSGAFSMPSSSHTGLRAGHTKPPAEFETRRAPQQRSRAILKTGRCAVSGSTQSGSHAITAEFGPVAEISVMNPDFLTACLADPSFGAPVLCASAARPVTKQSNNVTAAPVIPVGLGIFNEGDRNVSGI